MNELISTRRKRTTDDNVIPLINIVFLLLIFFMVAGQIQRIPAEAIRLPVMTITPEQAPLADFIELTADGRLLINDQLTDARQLAAQVSTLSTVTLIADASISARQLEDVAAVLRTVGGLTVRLAIQQADGEIQ